VSFAPAISVKAAKAVGQKVRAWHLNRRSGTDLSGLAEEIDPQVRGFEVAVQDLNERRLDRNPPVFSTVAAHMDDGAVVGPRTSPPLAQISSSERRPASRAVRMIARSRSTQSRRRRCSVSVCRAPSSAATDPAGNAFGNVLATFGRPICGMGFAETSSDVERYVLSTFQVDQHRRIDDASSISA
jgi:hypothetical protein